MTIFDYFFYVIAQGFDKEERFRACTIFSVWSFWFVWALLASAGLIADNRVSALLHNPYGHIAMYNGEQWISDFPQNDFWGGSAYRNQAEYTFFRYNN